MKPNAVFYPQLNTCETFGEDGTRTTFYCSLTGFRNGYATVKSTGKIPYTVESIANMMGLTSFSNDCQSVIVEGEI
jgi:hypothetical protein